MATGMVVAAVRERVAATVAMAMEVAVAMEQGPKVAATGMEVVDEGSGSVN